LKSIGLRGALAALALGSVLPWMPDEAYPPALSADRLTRHSADTDMKAIAAVRCCICSSHTFVCLSRVLSTRRALAGALAGSVTAVTAGL
jgi:hypothetical protein